MNPYSQAKSVPGIEFFQSMLKGAGMPSGFTSWMAPTMDPEELDQKITDLKAVLQWLEANARLTQATIQALEVQRMTLSALKTMNVDLGNLAGRMSDAMQAGAQAMGAAVGEAMDAGVAGAASPSAQAVPEEPAPVDEAEPEAAPSPLPGVMDPMQWWNAVSQQFSQVASQALRDSPWPMPGAGTPDAQAPATDAAPRTAPRRPAGAGTGTGTGTKSAQKTNATAGTKASAKAATAKPAAKAVTKPSSKPAAGAAKRAR